MVTELITDEIYRINADGVLTFNEKYRQEVLNKCVRFVSPDNGEFKFEWATPPEWSLDGHLVFTLDEVDEL